MKLTPDNNRRQSRVTTRIVYGNHFEDSGPDVEASAHGGCSLCGQPIMVSFKTKQRYLQSIIESLTATNQLIGGEGLIEVLDIYPKPKKADVSPDWPAKVQSRYKDAKLALLNADMSCEAVARASRSCLESALVNRGAEGSDLQAKISCVAKRGQITPEMKDWAHRIRVFGNEGSHDGDVTQIQAEEAVEFLTLFLRVFLTLPVEIKNASKTQTE